MSNEFQLQLFTALACFRAAGHFGEENLSARMQCVTSLMVELSELSELISAEMPEWSVRLDASAQEIDKVVSK